MPSPKRPRNENGLNADNTGRGLKLVTRPITKKRGKNAEMPTHLEARRGLDTTTYEGASQIDPNKPLTEKQKLFVKFWAQGESIPSASIRAGYGDGGTFAYRMVRMPNVLALYNEEKRLYEEAAGMTRKKVMDGIMEGIEMAKMCSEPASVINGWKTIGQMCGYFEPVKQKIEMTVNGKIELDRMDGMSDQQLMELIEQRARQAIAEAAQGALPAPGEDHEE